MIFADVDRYVWLQNLVAGRASDDVGVGGDGERTR